MKRINRANYRKDTHYRRVVWGRPRMNADVDVTAEIAPADSRQAI